MSPFVSPRPGLPGCFQTALANAHRLRRVLRHLPFIPLRSDVRDVVYLNWVVPTAALASLIPTGIRIAEHDGRTILTVLTYAHGHFGPSLFGPLRRLFPSPLQSNWRLYVASIDGRPPAAATVLFLHNLFDSALYAIGTRLFSDALPSHLPQTFRHLRTGDTCETLIESGAGSAPGLSVRAIEATDRILPAAFATLHGDWDRAVAALSLQDAAVARVGDDRLALARIDLPIDPASAIPMTVTAFEPGEWLRTIGATDPPFCFRVPAVPFRVLSETML